MSLPAPQSHWVLRGTVVVVAKVNNQVPPPSTGVVYAVTEDGCHRTYELDWFRLKAVPATAEQLGLGHAMSEWRPAKELAS